MRPEKWEKLVADIEVNFKIEEHKKKYLDDMGGTDIDYIIFEGPLGKMKLEFVVRPLVLDKKTNYAKKRMGGETGIEYIYSPDEKTYKLNAYKWDGVSWVEIEAGNFE